MPVHTGENREAGALHPLQTCGGDGDTTGIGSSSPYHVAVAMRKNRCSDALPEWDADAACDHAAAALSSHDDNERGRATPSPPQRESSTSRQTPRQIAAAAAMRVASPSLGGGKSVVRTPSGSTSHNASFRLASDRLSSESIYDEWTIRSWSMTAGNEGGATPMGKALKSRSREALRGWAAGALPRTSGGGGGRAMVGSPEPGAGLAAAAAVARQSIMSELQNEHTVTLAFENPAPKTVTTTPPSSVPFVGKTDEI